MSGWMDWPETVARYREMFGALEAPMSMRRQINLTGRNLVTDQLLGYVAVAGQPVEISTGVIMEDRAFGVTFPRVNGQPDPREQVLLVVARSARLPVPGGDVVRRDGFIDYVRRGAGTNEGERKVVRTQHAVNPMSVGVICGDPASTVLELEVRNDGRWSLVERAYGVRQGIVRAEGRLDGAS